MRASTKRALSIFLALFFVVGAMIVYNSLVKNEMAIIDEKRGIINSKTKLLEEESRAIAQTKALMERFEDISSLEESFSLSLPDDEDVIGSIRQIDSISRISGTDLVSLSFNVSPIIESQRSLVKGMGTLRVSLVVEGFYQEIKRFLELLETGVRVSIVEEFSFRPVRDDDDFYSMTVEFNMYYQE